MNHESVLRDILLKAYDHLHSIQLSVKTLQAKPADDKDAQMNQRVLSMIFNAINDIVHPGHEISLELFGEDKIGEFIKGLQQIFEVTKEAKIFPACTCLGCSLKENNEPASGNTNQA